MTKPTTLSFVLTPELKEWLEKQAATEDRSISWILRKILEARRREGQPAEREVEYRVD